MSACSAVLAWLRNIQRSLIEYLFTAAFLSIILLCVLFPLLLRSVSALLCPLRYIFLVLLLLCGVACVAFTLFPVVLSSPLLVAVALLDVVELPHDLLVQIEVAVHHSKTNLHEAQRSRPESSGVEAVNQSVDGAVSCVCVLCLGCC